MSDTDGKCLAVCGGCGMLVVPFMDHEGRDVWIGKHQAGTGHDPRPVDGWPDAETAVLRAYGMGGRNGRGAEYEDGPRRGDVGPR